MKKIAIATTLVLLSSITYAQNNEIPAAKIEKVLKTYADSIGCNFSFNRKDIVPLTGVGPDYVALYDIDIGCAGGSGTTGSALAAISYEDSGRHEDLYVSPIMSEPSAQVFGMPRFVERIFLKGGNLWFAGKVHGKDDSNNFPTIPVQSALQLIKTDVRVDEKNTHRVYFWKSDQDFWNY